jgi:uncharacterized cupredoxin-like copper-binding protein
MLKHQAVAALALAAVAGLAVPAPAADGAAPIKVALLDMSATMGMGPMGQAMMAPWMMMGPGGMGMMGPGAGQGRMGMMGPGMSGGMMSIRIDRSTVKAGMATFDITNWSRSALHEVLVVAVDNPGAQLPYDYTKEAVAEDQVKVLGETKELPPNASEQLTVDLDPGTYLLICNIPGHYAAGMATPLSVTP